jgi:hypothetical protein
MPVTPRVAHAAEVLDVAYRASEQPQEVTVRVETGGVAPLPLGPWAMQTLLECINGGAAGGSEFAPAAGRAELLSGPTGTGAAQDDELGPHYTWRLALQGVSPRFVRTMVEQLGATGDPHGLQRLSVVGSLVPDRSPMSVRGQQVAAWMQDPAAHVGCWPKLEFPVKLGHVPRGACIKVRVQGVLTDVVAAGLQSAFSVWQSAVVTYPSLSGHGPGFVSPHGSFARTASLFVARVTLFDLLVPPAVDVLSNVLGRAHAALSPIAEVEVGVP